MKTVWIAQWEIVPGNGVHTDQYPTFEAAKLAMREKISQNLHLEKYISWLRSEEDGDYAAAAHFLEQYLADPQFPRSAADIPERQDAPEHCELYLSESQIGWEYWYDECPRFHTNLVLNPCEDGPCEFHFWYEHPENLGTTPNIGMSIRIQEQRIWGTSANPLMVLLALDKAPATQDQIIRRIQDMFETTIDRKAVGRHLSLLAKLGYPLQQSSEGYRLDGEFGEPAPDTKFTSSAYPLMILQVLNDTPKTQAAIIQAVQEKYGAKIDRKAVKRHLELLEALGFPIAYKPDGYCLR